MTQVSLWLLPPPSISESLQVNIAELAKEYEGSHPFEPHVTIVGGIECESPTNLATLLTQGLHGFGGIPCRFRKEVINMSNPDNTLVWNQACVSVMERSKEFMLLNKHVRELLGMECEEWEFPAPLGEPHLSHYYGTQKAPCAQDVIRFDDFTAVEAGLWETSGGFEGVKNWKELARIKLLLQETNR
jgi:hypothetical protein